MDHVKGVRHNDQSAARLARLSADGPLNLGIVVKAAADRLRQRQPSGRELMA
jgi:hypothetical protein